MSKFDFIAQQATLNHPRGVSVVLLAKSLNEGGYRTDRGLPLEEHGRGIYRVVSAAYHRLINIDPVVAHLIAETFKRPNGDFAWCRK